MKAMSCRLASASLLALSLLHGVASAQPNPIFTGASPDVDAALRQRITSFFQAQQQGKFRDAQKYVSEDSIDNYIERDKVRYTEFEIHGVQWVGKDFKEAAVTMVVPFEMQVMGVGKIQGAKLPMTDHWKFEGGDWYWFVPKVDPCAPIQSPVGPITPECKDGKPVGASDPAADAQAALDKLIENSKVDPAILKGKVTANTTQVKLSTKKVTEGIVTFNSQFEGPITLDLITGRIRGLTVAFDGATEDNPWRVTLAPKKTATLRFKFEPDQADMTPDLVGMQVRVEPLAVSLPVNVSFAE